MICSVTDFRNKEVVNINTGEKFGFVSDVEIDTEKRYRRFTAQFEMNMLVFRKPAYTSPVLQPVDGGSTLGLSNNRPIFIDMVKDGRTLKFEMYDRAMFPDSEGVRIRRGRPFEYHVDAASGACHPRLRTGLRSVRPKDGRDHVLLVRFSYTQTRDSVFSVLDDEDMPNQSWRIPAAGVPTWFEAFVPVERFFNFEWKFDSAKPSAAVLRDMRYRILWTDAPMAFSAVSDGAQALRVSDMAAFMMIGDDRSGRLVEYSPTSEMFYRPKDKRTEDYITGRFG